MGVAVKVTLVPSQIGPVGAWAMVMLGVTIGFTPMAKVLLVAVAVERHNALLVMVQIT